MFNVVQIKMNQVSKLLFHDAMKIHRFNGEKIVTRLSQLNVSVESIGPCKKFRYTDGTSFSVLMSFSGSGDICTISLSAELPDDQGGWENWSKENEMKRLDIQKTWMRRNGIKEISTGSFRVSNCFSPQDGSSSITIYNAQPGHGLYRENAS